MCNKATIELIYDSREETPWCIYISSVHGLATKHLRLLLINKMINRLLTFES